MCTYVYFIQLNEQSTQFRSGLTRTTSRLDLVEFDVYFIQLNDSRLDSGRVWRLLHSAERTVDSIPVGFDVYFIQLNDSRLDLGRVWRLFRSAERTVDSIWVGFDVYFFSAEQQSTRIGSCLTSTPVQHNESRPNLGLLHPAENVDVTGREKQSAFQNWFG